MTFLRPPGPVGPPGNGKTATLQELRPALEAWSVVLWADKLSTFGTFLKRLFRALWDACIAVDRMDPSKDPEADLKAWGRRYPGQEPGEDPHGRPTGGNWAGLELLGGSPWRP